MRLSLGRVLATGTEGANWKWFSMNLSGKKDPLAVHSGKCMHTDGANPMDHRANLSGRKQRHTIISCALSFNPNLILLEEIR